MREYATCVVATATAAAPTIAARRAVRAAPEPPRRRRHRRARSRPRRPARHRRTRAPNERLDRREHEHQERRVVVPAADRAVAVPDPPGARDDVRLVRVEERVAAARSGRRRGGAPPRATRIAASAIRGAQTSGRRVTDERPDVAAGDEHGVDAGPLELGDLVAARADELGDRELPGRDVRQQLEQPLEVMLVRRRPPRPRAAGSRDRRARARARARPRHARGGRTRARARATSSTTSAEVVALLARHRRRPRRRPPPVVERPVPDARQRQSRRAHAVGRRDARRALRRPAPRPSARRARRRPRRERRCRRPPRSPGSACAWPVTDVDATQLVGTATVRSALRCRRASSSASACSAPSRPARRRWPRRSPTRTRRSGTPSTAGLHGDRSRAGRARGRAAEFTHIARIQCWYEDFLAGSRDACCSATRTRSRRRCSTRSTSGARAPASTISSTRRYDLYLVCGLDVPWHARRRSRVRGRSALDARALLARAQGERRAMAARARDRPRPGSRQPREAVDRLLDLSLSATGVATARAYWPTGCQTVFSSRKRGDLPRALLARRRGRPA